MLQGGTFWFSEVLLREKGHNIGLRPLKPDGQEEVLNVLAFFSLFDVIMVCNHPLLLCVYWAVASWPLLGMALMHPVFMVAFSIVCDVTWSSLQHQRMLAMSFVNAHKTSRYFCAYYQ